MLYRDLSDVWAGHFQNTWSHGVTGLNHSWGTVSKTQDLSSVKGWNSIDLPINQPLETSSNQSAVPRKALRLGRVDCWIVQSATFGHPATQTAKSNSAWHLDVILISAQLFRSSFRSNTSWVVAQRTSRHLVSAWKPVTACSSMLSIQTAGFLGRQALPVLEIKRQLWAPINIKQSNTSRNCKRAGTFD